MEKGDPRSGGIFTSSTKMKGRRTEYHELLARASTFFRGVQLVRTEKISLG